jgi:hypothetical protein
MAYRPGTAGRTYPLPVADSCSSCHVDRHAPTSSASRWQRCADCHAQVAWSPSSFGLSAHEGTHLALTGAHAATPCVACHRDPEHQDPDKGHARFQLDIAAESCADCHTGDNPHPDRFVGLACETCHGTESFDEIAFDHAALPDVRSACAGCHAPEDPHAGQFVDRDCSSCHETDGYEIESFDHAATRFPLDGAHDDTPCASCHVRDPADAGAAVRYRPLGTECVDCHGVANAL